MKKMPSIQPEREREMLALRESLRLAEAARRAGVTLDVDASLTIVISIPRKGREPRHQIAYTTQEALLFIEGMLLGFSAQKIEGAGSTGV